MAALSDLVVVDSSILVDASRRHPAAESYVTTLVRSASLGLHPVVIAEVLTGAVDRPDLTRLSVFLDSMQKVRCDAADFDDAIELLVRHRLRDGVGWPDCLIAATCIRLDLPVATLNSRHFRVFKGLRVMQPY